MKTTEGRILDKDFEEQINSGIHEAHKQLNSNIHQAHRQLDSNIHEAKKYMQKKQSMIEDAVSEHPFEYVLGAFVGGLILGALISKK